jgi:uncharacterized protein (DUF58 family)
MRITKGSLKLSTALSPGEKTELSYTFETARGRYNWKHLKAQVRDPLDCTALNVYIPAEATIFVLPRYQKHRPFQIRPWKMLTSPGCIPSSIGGRGTDFRGVREYHPGDSLKAMDWRLSAKHPHKFFTKEFEEEKTADIQLILDARVNTDIISEGKKLFDMGIESAASLSDMFLHRGHRVALSIIGDKIIQVQSGFGNKQRYRILTCLAEAKTGTCIDNDSLERFTIGQFSSKATVFVISPYLYMDFSFYRNLRFHGLQVILICPDSYEFMKRELYFKKPSDVLALRAAKIERKLNLSLLSQLSVYVIDWKTDQPLMPLVRNAFYKHKPIRKL